ncbi:MAG: hypothetical protein C0395_03580, partial [Gemmatimonas sp.]|nr:hypothetical protein [Gemmatimonas sp.]
MKRILKTAAPVLLLLAAATLASPALAARSKPWEKIKTPALGEIRLPDYQRVQLDNGMVLYLAEDHELPMIELSATIRAGQIYEPEGKTGLAALTGEVLRTGGTASWSGDEIDERMESLGAMVETYVEGYTAGAYLSALTEDADQALAILAEVLRSPRFAEDKLDLAKTQHKAGIARRNDEPMSIARREFSRVILGPDHPLARNEEYDTLGAIARQDLVDFHADWFGPDRTYLVVIGDFDAAAMTGKIEAAFAGWPAARRPLPADPVVPDLPRTVNVAPKADLTQSTVILGHKGIRNDDPHYAGIEVANRILGGGFASRLFNEVRSARGLAYSTGSASGTGWRQPGVFVAYAGTKSESTEQAASVMIEQIEKMTREPVTAAELRTAVDGILNSDVFNYDTKREVLDRMVLFEMNGYPADFLTGYRAAVQAMTAEQVLEACRAVWKPELLSVLAVGNPADFDGDLSRFGAVNMIDITIPEPKLALEIPAATPESLAAGQKLLDRAAAAVGGKKLADMKGFATKQTLAAEIQGMSLNITMETTIVLPDRLKLIQKLPFGESTQVLDGDKGWVKSPMGVQDIEGADAAKMRDQIEGDMLMLLRDHAGRTCQALSP